MTPSDRQSLSDASTAREAQREAAERDRPFWEAAFCAALTGIMANEGQAAECGNQARKAGMDDASGIAILARHLANAALVARNARWPEREDSDG